MTPPPTPTEIVAEAEGLLETGDALKAMTALAAVDVVEIDDAGLCRRLAEAHLAAHEAAERAGYVPAPYRMVFSWGEIPFPVVDEFPPSQRAAGIAALERCLVLDPDDHTAAVRLSHCFLDDGEALARAAALAQNVLKGAPDMAAAHSAMARLGLQTGNVEIAERALSRLQELDAGPDATRAWLLSSIRAEDSEDVVLPSDIFDALTMAQDVALALAGGSLNHEVRDRLEARIGELAGALCRHAAELMRDGSPVPAARLLSAAAALVPDSPTTSLAAGLLLFQAGHERIAPMAIGNARKLAREQAVPDPFDTFDAVGKALPDAFVAFAAANGGHEWLVAGQDHLQAMAFADAESIFRDATEHWPENQMAWLELSRACFQQGRPEDALAAARHAGELDPADPLIRMEAAASLLCLGRVEEAWPLFESRLEYYRASSPRPAPPVPRWQGETGPEKTLLVWREEGIGDEVEFASCLFDLAQRWQGRMVFECTPRLVELFRRAFPGVDVRAEDPHRLRYDGIDAQVPLGSLPLHLRCDLAAFKEHPPTLVPDPTRVAHWRERLAALGPGPKVGINWRSLNSGWTKRAQYLEVADLAPILRLPGVVSVSLQIGAEPGERDEAARLAGAYYVFDEVDLHDDLEEACALMAALDAVVSSRCWVIIFAGALGLKGYCPARQPSPLMLGQERFPWYPQVKIRYAEPGAGWDRPVAEIAGLLRARFDL